MPTLWIVLVPLGQSITAAHTLGTTAMTVLPAPYGTAFEAMGLVYGYRSGLSDALLALAIAATIHTAHEGMPFSLIWWSFTFPWAPSSPAPSGLAVATGAHFIAVTAGGFYIGLLVAWGTVAVRTGHGVFHDHLLCTPA